MYTIRYMKNNKEEVVMKAFRILLVMMFVFVSIIDFSKAESNDDSTQMLGDAVLGGLLGAGAGAAIGSASGDAGKGAAVGAGVGALGGVLLGTMRRSSRRRSRYDDEDGYYERGHYKPYKRSPQKYSYDDGYYKPGVHRKLIREYDEEGNVISEKEVYYDDEEEKEE